MRDLRSKHRPGNQARAEKNYAHPPSRVEDPPARRRAAPLLAPELTAPEASSTSPPRQRRAAPAASHVAAVPVDGDARRQVSSESARSLSPDRARAGPGCAGWTTARGAAGGSRWGRPGCASGVTWASAPKEERPLGATARSPSRPRSFDTIEHGGNPRYASFRQHHRALRDLGPGTRRCMAPSGEDIHGRGAGPPVSCQVSEPRRSARARAPRLVRGRAGHPAPRLLGLALPCPTRPTARPLSRARPYAAHRPRAGLRPPEVSGAGQPPQHQRACVRGPTYCAAHVPGPDLPGADVPRPDVPRADVPARRSGRGPAQWLPAPVSPCQQSCRARPSRPAVLPLPAATSGCSLRRAMTVRDEARSLTEEPARPGRARIPLLPGRARPPRRAIIVAATWTASTSTRTPPPSIATASPSSATSSAPDDLAEVRRVLALLPGQPRRPEQLRGLQHRARLHAGRAGARLLEDRARPAHLALASGTCSRASCSRRARPSRSGPGETPQPFHADDSFYTVPRPRPMVSLSTIVAVDAFTAENGGTEVVPGSHLWSDAELAGLLDADHGRGARRARSALAALARPVEMPAGACVVFAGTLVHRGGANRSAGPRCAFSNQYCQPWARQQENFTLRSRPRSRGRCRRGCRSCWGTRSTRRSWGSSPRATRRRRWRRDTRTASSRRRGAPGRGLPE